MIIDLRSKQAAPMTEAKRKRELTRAKLSCKTVKELRQFACDNHISLGGESSKQGILTEIMGQYGHQWGPRKEN